MKFSRKLLDIFTLKLRECFLKIAKNFLKNCAQVTLKMSESIFFLIVRQFLVIYMKSSLTFPESIFKNYTKFY